MKTGRSEAETIAQVERVYSEWGGQLLRFAQRLCRSTEDAEDIVVESFAHAYRNWNSLREGGNRRAWLYGIAVNCYRMKRRKEKLDSRSIGDEVIAGETHMLDQIALKQAIAKLPESQREAFILVKGEGLTAREAAEILGRPLGTVLSDVYRAVHALRSILIGAETEPSPLGRLCEVDS